MGIPGGSAVRICLSVQETQRHRFSPWVEKIPWRMKWQPTPVFLPTEGPGGLQSMGSQRVGHNLVTKQQQQQRSRVRSTSSFVWCSTRGDTWGKSIIFPAETQRVLNKKLGGRGKVCMLEMNILF